MNAYPTTALSLLAALGVASLSGGASAAADKATLFDAIDADGNGAIQLTELRTDTADWSFAVDVDGDGTFTREETVRGWEGTPSLKAEEILDALDADGSGEVERAEFVQAAVSEMDTDEARKMTLFDVLDIDGDGAIELTELRTDTADWKLAVDVDEDGRFSRDEVIYGWEGAPALKAETILNELDADSSGAVEREELAAASVGRLEVGMRETAPLFDAIDADGDGAIQLTELRSDTAEWSFAVDVDGDGTFTRDETIHGWEGATALKAEKVLNALDTDGSGEVERSEFVDMDVAQYYS